MISLSPPRNNVKLYNITPSNLSVHWKMPTLNFYFPRVRMIKQIERNILVWLNTTDYTSVIEQNGLY